MITRNHAPLLQPAQLQNMSRNKQQPTNLPQKIKKEKEKKKRHPTKDSQTQWQNRNFYKLTPSTTLPLYLIENSKFVVSFIIFIIQ